MEKVKVLIDRIVVDFTNVYWDFFNPFQQQIRQYFNAPLRLREKGFKYHIPDRKMIIKNIPTYESDGDEYPKLIIEQATIAVFNYKEAYIGKNVKDIIILRDKVTWQKNSDKWIVDSDIGIKLIFENEVIVLLAHDSLAGLLKVFNLNKEQPIGEYLEEYWSMKTDQLISLIREEIYI